MSDVPDGFVKNLPYNRGMAPQFTITDVGAGYFNKATERKWLDGYDKTGIYLDPDEKVIGFAPGEDHRDTYALTRGNQSGPVVCTQSALAALQIDPKKLDTPVHVPVEKSGDLLLVDLSEVADDG